jgi:hypothetical protein
MQVKKTVPKSTIAMMAAYVAAVIQYFFTPTLTRHGFDVGSYIP